MRPGLRVYPVTGPPGAGKTTALLCLADEHEWLARFGVRDYGLALAAAGHPLGLSMRDALLRGNLLPDDLVQREFTHFLHRLPDKVRVVAVEGYPRDRRQSAQFFEAVAAAGGAVAGLIVVDVPDSIVWRRVADRRICAACGRLVTRDVGDRCPACGGAATRRGDDARHRLAHRLHDYRRLSNEVGAYFAERQALRVVHGSSSESEVREALLRLLSSRMDGEGKEMSASSSDMMNTRRAALDAMADLPEPGSGARPLTDIRIDVRQHLPDIRAGGIPASLLEAVVDRLVRDGARAGDGAALVTGLSHVFDLAAVRGFHEALFREVWARVDRRVGAEVAGSEFRIKTNVTSDGAIPIELYGSKWSFKQLHMDRDALLFSHLYGPVAGFGGGSLLLADIRTYLRRHRLHFDDLFDWSQEPTPGSKPVLRAEHHAKVMAECGADLGGLGPDQIVFVNNLPSAGVLHGVTPVEVRDRASFIREFHRCAVKRLAREDDDTVRGEAA